MVDDQRTALDPRVEYERTKARIIGTFTVGLALGAPTLGVLYGLEGAWFEAGMIQLLTAAGLFGTLFFTRRERSAIAGNVLVAAILLVVSYVDVVSAGPGFPLPFFLMLLPMIAALTSGLWSGLVWAALSVVTVVGNYVAVGAGYVGSAYSPDPSDHALFELFTVIIGIGACAAVTLIPLVLERDLVRRLLGAKEAAEAATQAKTRYLAMVSHEARDAVGSIQSMLWTMNDIDDLDRDEVMRMMAHSAADTIKLFEGLVDQAQILEGQIDLVREVQPLSVLIEPLQVWAEPLAAEKGLALVITAEPAVSSEAMFDRRLLSRVLSNLVRNAIKYSDSGEVKVELRVAGGSLLCTVSDQGVGIAPEHLEKVFAAWERGAHAACNVTAGVGLGLSICRNLVTLMNGQISVQSDPGVRTTFAVSLPSD
jgi:signal transduction histidine kinase